MTQEPRERGHDPAALSADLSTRTEAAVNGHAPVVLTAMTLEERQTAEFLAGSLGQLREARPGFQNDLERRLLARLAVPARPWWHAFVPGRARIRPHVAGLRRLPRRSMLGLAAASTLALLAASLSASLVGAPEASAREILEKAQANVENPLMAGVNSYHLTAKMWSNHQPPGSDQPKGPRESTTEQWFISPDKMRTETRTVNRDGKPVISGFMLDGGQAKHYGTEDVNDALIVGFFAVPASPLGASGGKPPAGGPAGATTETVTITSGIATKPAASGTVVAGSAGVAGPRTDVVDGPTGGQGFGVRIAVQERADGSGDNNEDDRQVVVFGEGCPEPKRTGEGTVAGRAVFVIENDLSSCLPANAPDDMAGKHVRWVDQKTFLPLKMEMYARGGALVDRYEVTSIEYDVTIPAKTFTELPAGTSLRDPKMLPAMEVRKP